MSRPLGRHALHKMQADMERALCTGPESDAFRLRDRWPGKWIRYRERAVVLIVVDMNTALETRGTGDFHDLLWFRMLILLPEEPSKEAALLWLVSSWRCCHRNGPTPSAVVLDECGRVKHII